MSVSSSTKQTNIQKRRRLSALYERGKEVRFGANEQGEPIIKTDDDPKSDDDVVIYVGPPSPLHREMAIREAQAERARVMLEARSKEDSTQYVVARSFLQSLGMDALIDYVLEIDEPEVMSQARREVLLEKEWEDFNQLRDTMRRFEEAGSPWDDDEWKPFLARDKEFGDQVFKRSNDIRLARRDGYALMPRPELENKALEKRIDQAGTNVFVRVYEEWTLFYGCRDPEDRVQTFFEDLSDLKSMPDEVQKVLSDTLAEFIADSSEAKNSQAVGPGSVSAQPQNEPEILPSSTPEDVIGF